MVVALAGAHGKIAMRLTRLLAGGEGKVIGVIRNPDHVAEVRLVVSSPAVLSVREPRSKLST
jgi:hypothetical protein